MPWSSVIASAAQEIARGVSTGLTVAAASQCPACSLSCAPAPLCPDCVCEGRHRVAQPCEVGPSLSVLIAVGLWLVLLGAAAGFYLGLRCRAPATGRSALADRPSRGVWLKADGSGPEVVHRR